MQQTRKRLGDMLVEANLITIEQVEKTLIEKEPKEKLGEALIRKGLITEHQLIEVLEEQLGIPKVSLYNYPFDEKLFNLIPKVLAKKNNIIPMKRTGNELFVAMADPMDFYLINDLRLSTGFQITPIIATKDDISRAIAKYYDLQDFVGEWLEVRNSITEPEAIKEEVGDDESPIIQLVNSILQSAIGQHASDIHIDPREKDVLIRLRVDGKLQNDRTLPKDIQGVLLARIKIMANLDITERRQPQDGRIRTLIDVRQVDLRIATLPTIFGEKVVIRILDMNQNVNHINQLGFSASNFKKYTKMIQAPHGLVLITGPTGSGKSSTMYASINKLNNEDVNIVSIEDPVEYQLEGINQVQVNTAAGMTFASGLRAILRQDPNVIMLGEIRDRETAEIAVRASLTGHLVLSTLHTNDSISTLMRLVDMGVESFLVASSLMGVVSQRLVRRICRDCRTEVSITNREKEIFSELGITVKSLYRGIGCQNCYMTGYRGRIAIHEVLTIDDRLRRALLDGESNSVLYQIAKKNGTTFLLEDGLQKVAEGFTTTEEVLKIVNLSE